MLLLPKMLQKKKGKKPKTKQKQTQKAKALYIYGILNLQLGSGSSENLEFRAPEQVNPWHTSERTEGREVNSANSALPRTPNSSTSHLSGRSCTAMWQPCTPCWSLLLKGELLSALYFHFVFKSKTIDIIDLEIV